MNTLSQMNSVTILSVLPGFHLRRGLRSICGHLIWTGRNKGPQMTIASAAIDIYLDDNRLFYGLGLRVIGFDRVRSLGVSNLTNIRALGHLSLIFDARYIVFNF